jgi:tripartite-type tricarboxylate transporter receptor subunit TctC
MRPAPFAAALVSTMLIAAGSQPTLADAMAAFYSGKTVRIIVGFAPGGGYDLYARTLARHMGRHIPGNPTVVAQNMPGAGSLKAVNYLYSVAPKDGTVIATFARGIVFEPLLGRVEGIQFDATRLNWVGSISNEVSVCALSAGSGIKTWQDMKTKTYVIGASGTGADSDVFPTVLRNLFRLPLKIVTGYPGGADLVLAMERHEIDGRCGWSWSSLVSRHRALYDGKQINVTLQIGLDKHEDLSDVPLLAELADDTRAKAALKLITSRQTMARPFALPPGVPDERTRVLQAAFDATMRDVEFRAEAKQLDLEVRPFTGAAISALLGELYGAPPDVLKLASELMREAPAR